MPIAAAAPASQASKDESAVAADDGSALPSTASWAKPGSQPQQSRRGSQVGSATTASPKSGNAVIATAPEHVKSETDLSRPASVSEPSNVAQALQTAISDEVDTDVVDDPSSEQWQNLLKLASSPHFKFEFSRSVLTADDYDAIIGMPPLIDSNGGLKLKLRKDQDEEERRMAQEALSTQLESIERFATEEQQQESGSFQLGGEAEIDHDQGDSNASSHLGTIGSAGSRQLLESQLQNRGQNDSPSLGLGSPGLAGLNNLSINGRGLTPQQQQQLLIFKGANPQSNALIDQSMQSYTASGSAANRLGTPTQQQHLNSFQSSNQAAPSYGHGRQASRYTFANDAAPANVKPAVNTQHMAQQANMMPSGASAQDNQRHQSLLTNQFYSGGVQGPPPGLKSAGTPPVSGGGMFGHGHGFAGGMTGGLGLGNKNSDSEGHRDMFRGQGGRGSAGSGAVADTGKREFMFPSFLNQFAPNTAPASASGLSDGHYGAHQDSGTQKHKKKGKKHRHANTSSSGGGVVDLADPSILQARLQQQHASSGQGQGLFGAQNQGGYNPNMMYGGSSFSGRGW
jgi:CCR4-NOT transcription complex subunit 4